MSVATIGSALAEKRHELGLEKGQAADKIGMSRTTYSSYEQDTQRPSVDVFPALAEFLKVSIEELLDLYGATCVAAVRPSLERLLADQDGESSSASGNRALLTSPDADGDEPSKEVVLELIEVMTQSDDIGSPPSMASDAWNEPRESSSDDDESANEVVLELQEVMTQSDDIGSPPSMASDAWNEPRESSSDDDEPSGEVILEVHEEVTQPDIPDIQEQVSISMPGLTALAKPDQAAAPPERVDEEVAPVVFEPSPYFIRTSLSGTNSHEAKKKKKKKKKKK
jgi:transcriptional regulator with XRE-family HTH domain